MVKKEEVKEESKEEVKAEAKPVVIMDVSHALEQAKAEIFNEVNAAFSRNNEEICKGFAILEERLKALEGVKNGGQSSSGKAQ